MPHERRRTFLRTHSGGSTRTATSPHRCSCSISCLTPTTRKSRPGSGTSSSCSTWGSPAPSPGATTTGAWRPTTSTRPRTLALVRAVQGFDPGRGHDFLAYAIPTIRGEIKRHFRDQGWTIRPPRRVQETQREIHRADPDADGRDRCSNARLDDLAALIGRTRRDVTEALRANGCFTPTSLDMELAPGQRTTLGDSIADDDDWVSAVEARSITQLLLSRLDARDRRVVFLRYVQRVDAEVDRRRPGRHADAGVENPGKDPPPPASRAPRDTDRIMSKTDQIGLDAAGRQSTFRWSKA